MRSNQIHRASTRILYNVMATLVLLAVCSLSGSAQTNPDPPAVAAGDPVSQIKNTQTASVPATDSRYRVGPGDVLDIRVFNKPQFSREAVRVDYRGMIRMPFIEGEIRAACRTESELASEITTLLLEYARHPQVDVFVKEYQSQTVAVLGAVRAPSRFQLQRRVRLLDLLSFVNGHAENAGRTIQIVHTSTSPVCESSEPAPPDELSAVDYYRLNETLRGDEKANPYVRAGDIIIIPEADQVYVVGNVTRPSPLALTEPITISRAIAMVGGTLPDSKRDRVRIVRQAPGSTAKTEIFVDLKAIDKHEAEDVELRANDIVDVPTNSGKRLLKSFLGAFVPQIAQLPVRVIPGMCRIDL